MTATLTALLLLFVAVVAVVTVRNRARAAELAAERETGLMQEYLLWLETRQSGASAGDFDTELALCLSAEISRVCRQLMAKRDEEATPSLRRVFCDASQ